MLFEEYFDLADWTASLIDITILINGLLSYSGSTLPSTIKIKQ